MCSLFILVQMDVLYYVFLFILVLMYVLYYVFFVYISADGCVILCGPCLY